MGELGLFQDQRVELVQGEILTMNPQGPQHASAIQLTCDKLREAFGSGYWIRMQMPLHLGDDSAPEPDIAVVRGSPRDYQHHPRTALLVVEVSDTTLQYDKDRKQRLYAQAGIAEYWIINLVERCVEVFRDPQAGRYTTATTIQATDELSPLGMSAARFVADDLLP